MAYLTMLLFGMIIKMDRMQLTSLLTNEKRSIFLPIGNSHTGRSAGQKKRCRAARERA
jgi:hypothetical protein